MSVTSLSNQTITVENPTGVRDRHGQPAFSAGTSIACRFERTYKTVINETRQLEPIHAIAGVPGAATVEIGARVTYGSDKYRVIQVAEAIGPSGEIHHLELMLQLWSYTA